MKENILQIQTYFPTAIGTKNSLIEKEYLSFLKNKIYKIKNEIKNTNNFWLSAEMSPYNTMTDYNLCDDQDFNFLISLISENIKIFASAHNDYEEYFCKNSWFNVYQSENFQEPHHHSYPCVYSAVFFLSAPEGSGKIVFQSPFTQYVNESKIEHGENYLTNSYVYFTPEENKLLIFKSNLVHYVLPGNNKEDRISLAFNFIPSIYKN